MGKRSIFTDDAVQRFQEFVQIIWDDDTLTQNLNFAQESLNREIEDYLVNHFWKYHVKMYSKKPIYWLFASKKNAFQVLVYMHRMNRFTAEKIRDKYLLKHIQHLQQQIQSLETKGGALTREEQKKLDQLRTDELECSDYELVLKDVATQQIEFDLDDGVTKNYALFQKVVAPIK